MNLRWDLRIYNPYTQAGEPYKGRFGRFINELIAVAFDLAFSVLIFILLLVDVWSVYVGFILYSVFNLFLFLRK